MPLLDTSTISLGDTVFSMGYGSGKVVELLTADRYVVRFEVNGKRVAYEGNGVQVRMPYRSLYWADPIVALPKKGTTRWNRLKPVMAELVLLFDGQNTGQNTGAQ